MTTEQRIVSVAIAIITVTALAAGAGYLRSLRQAPPTTAPAPPRAPAPPAVTWPLTGEPATSSVVIQRRVMCVKIENAPEARPQTGLSSADVVYELLTEGGITRFSAMYHSMAPSRVGPVRSARLPDIHLVRQYKAVLAYSGADFVTQRAIVSSGIDGITESTGDGAFTRSAARPIPHNLYASVPRLRQVAARLGFAVSTAPPALEFGAASSPSTAAPVARVSFNDANRVLWRWDPASRRYLRELNGSPMGDAGSSRPYAAANVIVMFADRVPGPREDIADWTVGGSGDAVVWRDGRRFDATWDAAGDASPPRFTGSDGGRLPLATGPTWIEVLTPAQRASVR